jgi:hypothetical protein
MKKLKFEVPNSLPLEEAQQRVEALLTYWGKKYGVQSSWSGHAATMSGKAMGVSFDGGLEVQATRIAGEAADPGLLLRGQAQKYLTKKFGEYLDPSRSIEDLLKSEQ